MNQSLSARYKVLQIFEGGSSLLQKVQDLRTNQTMVLKFPKRPEAQKRIAREARVFQHLAREGSIPGLVRFFGYDENQEDPSGSCLSLEFLQGTTLATRLETHGVLSENETISIGRSLCRILSELHSRKVIHRDISINNIILLEGSGDVRLIDLGLALVRREDGGYEPHDMGRVGTPATRAPELSDSFSGDERCDIYSLGEVLYQLANGPETSAQKKSGLNAEVKSQISAGLSRVIARCEQKPQARYQTARDLDKALQNLQIKKIAVRVSAIAGTLLLAGTAYSFYPFNQTKAAPLAAPQSSTAPTRELTVPETPITQPTTTSAPVVEVPAKPPIEKISVTSAAPEPIPPGKQAKPKEAPQNMTKIEEPESLLISGNAPPREEPESDEESDAIMRAKLLKIATEPTPIVKPKPIEIRVTTPTKK